MFIALRQVTISELTSMTDCIADESTHQFAGLFMHCRDSYIFSEGKR